MLQVGTIRMGVTNGDVLMELMSNSYRRLEPTGVVRDRQEKGVDNQTLFCAQLVEQRSLYPLYPSLSTPLDASRIRSLSCDAMPDIQIIATDKMKFVKEVKGTLFVAPGPLAMRNAGGTYARITVYPFKQEFLDSEREKGSQSIPNNVVKRCKAEIIAL